VGVICLFMRRLLLLFGLCQDYRQSVAELEPKFSRHACCAG